MDGHDQGTATVIEDEGAIQKANRHLNRKYGVDDDSWSENVLVRIDVETVASKRWYGSVEPTVER